MVGWRKDQAREGGGDGSRVCHRIQCPLQSTTTSPQSPTVHWLPQICTCSIASTDPRRPTGALHGVEEQMFPYSKETLMAVPAQLDTVAANLTPLFLWAQLGLRIWLPALKHSPFSPESGSSVQIYIIHYWCTSAGCGTFSNVGPIISALFTSMGMSSNELCVCVFSLSLYKVFSEETEMEKACRRGAKATKHSDLARTPAAPASGIRSCFCCYHKKQPRGCPIARRTNPLVLEKRCLSKLPLFSFNQRFF